MCCWIKDSCVHLEQQDFEMYFMFGRSCEHRQVSLPAVGLLIINTRFSCNRREHANNIRVAICTADNSKTTDQLPVPSKPRVNTYNTNSDCCSRALYCANNLSAMRVRWADNNNVRSRYTYRIKSMVSYHVTLAVRLAWRIAATAIRVLERALASILFGDNNWPNPTFVKLTPHFVRLAPDFFRHRLATNLQRNLHKKKFVYLKCLIF